MKSFKELTLPPAIHRALEQMKFDQPTPIQAQAIPVALAGRDLIGCAQTGTGKTAAFCIPVLDRLLADPEATALMLAPTREIAQQIELFWRDLSQFCPDVMSAILIGGASMQPQLRALAKRPRVLVATPGRLIDHLRTKRQLLAKTSMLVLDEADRMLDMGFAPQLRQILQFVPRERQTFLFSATWDSNVDQLAKAYTANPTRVSVGTASRAATTIQQTSIETSSQKKNETLLAELNQREGSILVFARTKSRTDRVARYLSMEGVNAYRIHGGRSQAQRNAALNAFKSGVARVLVATDLAARGIDVANITCVINFDLPMDPEDYIHRIGRTGRAGAAGTALSIVTPEDRMQWRDIVRFLQKSGSPVPTVVAAAVAPPKAAGAQPQVQAQAQPQARPAPRARRPHRGQGGQTAQTGPSPRKPQVMAISR